MHKGAHMHAHTCADMFICASGYCWEFTHSTQSCKKGRKGKWLGSGMLMLFLVLLCNLVIL